MTTETRLAAFRRWEFGSTGRQSGRPLRLVVGLLTVLAIGFGPFAGPAGAVASPPPASPAPHWTVTASLPYSMPDATACPTASLCFAAGERDGGPPAPLFASRDGGRTWTRQLLPSAVAIVTGLSCPTAVRCVGVGRTAAATGVVIRTIDGGAHWSVRAVPSGEQWLTAVSCGTPTFCVAVGVASDGNASIAVSHDGGATWTQHTLAYSAAGYLYGISCVDGSRCLAVGGSLVPTAVSTTDSGCRWQVLPIPVANYNLSSVTCFTTGRCLAVGSSASSGSNNFVYLTPDLGRHWRTVLDPAGVFQLYSIACATPSTCQAGGSAGIGLTDVMIETTDGGAHWTKVSVPNAFWIASVSCPAVSECVAGAQSSTGSGKLFTYR